MRIKKAKPFLTLPHSLTIEYFYFLNFLLTPISPTIPEPRRSMVEGSGTGSNPDNSINMALDRDG